MYSKSHYLDSKSQFLLPYFKLCSLYSITFKTYGISPSFTIMHNICVLINMLICVLDSMLLFLLILYLHATFLILKFGGKSSLLHWNQMVVCCPYCQISKF